MINEALRLSKEEQGSSILWLADRYDTLPNYDPKTREPRARLAC
jgi:hypothetical protein